MKINIDLTLENKDEIKYIFEIFLRNQGINYTFEKDPLQSEFIISNNTNSDLFVDTDFFKNLNLKEFDFGNYFKNDCFVKNKDGANDYLCTAFYMINSIQEFNNSKLDEYGRFNYLESYQFKFKNIEENLIQNCFNSLYNSNEKLKKQKSRNFKTKFFLSHDIDTVYGAILQDGYYALRKGRVDTIMKLILNILILRPDWLNVDKIMNLESEFDFKSTFYWLVNKGKLNNLERNSDYSINNSKIRKSLNLVKEKGWENGLHKSISVDSFTNEIKKLGFIPEGNRYHFLKFNLPKAYKNIQQSGLRLDSSLGFAEAMGFRNSYGLPFHPYDFENKRPYDFLEVPLNIMDQTFFGYLKLSPQEISKKVIEFFEKNKWNSIISVLWHNNFFSDNKYKGYTEAYREILSYFYDEKFECITQTELLKNDY